MSARFVNLNRQTLMFLPCDLREWLPADHLVHFILNTVEQLPTSHFHVNHRGTGTGGSYRNESAGTNRLEIENERVL